ncbi:MAG TPA: PepSY-associated TM helix domain-containing protein [Drouetiella sp.]|jgi:uncharacterized iron-regulated membrane protein
MGLRKSLRKWAFLSHLWIGIVLSAYFAMLGLTGSFLMFKTDLQPIFEPRLHHVEVPPDRRKVSLDRIVKTFDTITHCHIYSMTLPEVDGDPLIIGFKPLTEPGGRDRDWRQCYFNPYTGEVLGDEVVSGKLFRTVRNLHANLLLQDLGSKLNGIGDLFLLVLLFSGLWLWFPSPKYFQQQFKQRTTIRFSSSSGRMNLDIHNAVGFYSSCMLLMFVLTATSALWHSQVEAVVFALTGTRSEQMQAAAPPAVFSYDEIINRVKGSLPGYEPAIITDNMHVLMAPPDHHQFIPSMVSVSINQDSGLVERIQNSESLPLGKQIMNWLMPIHFGQWGTGWLYYPIKLLWFLAGFCPLILAVTGVSMYLNKRSKSLDYKSAQSSGISVEASV